MFYLVMHSKQFMYSYIVFNMWFMTTQKIKEKTFMGYSLATRDLLYAPSHRQEYIPWLVTPVVEHWLE